MVSTGWGWGGGGPSLCAAGPKGKRGLKPVLIGGGMAAPGLVGRLKPGLTPGSVAAPGLVEDTGGWLGNDWEFTGMPGKAGGEVTAGGNGCNAGRGGL